VAVTDARTAVERQRIDTTRRRGRMSAAKRRTIDELGPRLGLPFADEDRALGELLRDAFGREAPCTLDVGVGNGVATLALAAERPDRDVLAVEVHLPSLAASLDATHASGATNVRVVDADARDLLDRAAPGDLHDVRVLFPDPWPKRRHLARRLVDADFVVRVAEVLPSGGTLHVATDWDGYADHVRAQVEADGRFALDESGRPPRPVTAYERMGLDAGRTIHDLVATRIG
jgi:tRNA (guanine-N7-)-methyltransferase